MKQELGPVLATLNKKHSSVSFESDFDGSRQNLLQKGKIYCFYFRNFLFLFLTEKEIPWDTFPQTHKSKVQDRGMMYLFKNKLKANRFS